MSKRSKSKISTDGADSALANNPFEVLNTGMLASGSTLEPTSPKATEKKLKSKGRVEVRREKAGRGGKTVTTLREFPSCIPLKELEAMTFKFKKSCACGGTLKGRAIELQGDVCDRLMAELGKLGYKPVRAGG
ncbi:MAG: translation initiation factor [Opitutae bacterium]|nr:translation initiation factor [Opitutae bacterium]